MIFIYALIHPITKELRYIGKSTDPEKRLAQHIREALSAESGNSRRNWNKRYAWICSLHKDNVVPELIVLESCESKEMSNLRERYWISITPNLVNMTSGGDGGDTNSGKKFGPFSEDTKSKIKQKTIEGMKSDEVRAKCRLGGSISGKKMQSDPEFRAKIIPRIREGAKKRICEINSDGKVFKIYASITDYMKIHNIKSRGDYKHTFKGPVCKFDTADRVEVITLEPCQLKALNPDTIFTYNLIELNE